VAALLATANFQPARLVGSGAIYDVEVHEKSDDKTSNPLILPPGTLA
jgi:hypothetical protein